MAPNGMNAAPVSAIDPFCTDFFAAPCPAHAALREAGPVVHLARYEVWAVAIEITGPPRRRYNNTLRGLASLPVTLHPA
ncbi:MAG: hypothetical protein ACREFK_03050 [Stellaceae bacterium]